MSIDSQCLSQSEMNLFIEPEISTAFFATYLTKILDGLNVSSEPS